MDKDRSLFARRLGDLRMGVTERKDGNSRAKIEILLSIKIPHTTARAACNVEFEPPICGHDKLAVQRGKCSHSEVGSLKTASVDQILARRSLTERQLNSLAVGTLNALGNIPIPVVHFVNLFHALDGLLFLGHLFVNK